jgi:hypothetical protein
VILVVIGTLALLGAVVSFVVIDGYDERRAREREFWDAARGEACGCPGPFHDDECPRSRP